MRDTRATTSAKSRNLSSVSTAGSTAALHVGFAETLDHVRLMLDQLKDLHDEEIEKARADVSDAKAASPSVRLNGASGGPHPRHETRRISVTSLGSVPMPLSRSVSPADMRRKQEDSHCRDRPRLVSPDAYKQLRDPQLEAARHHPTLGTQRTLTSAAVPQDLREKIDEDFCKIHEALKSEDPSFRARAISRYLDLDFELKEGDSLGLQAAVEDTDGGLRVQAVAEKSLVWEWGQQNVEIALQSGDLIVEVNGVADVSGMVAELSFARVRLTIFQEERYTVHFKHRAWRGKALHLAMLHWEADEQIVKAIIECRADVSEECATNPFVGKDQSGGNKTTAFVSLIQPVHIAAGCGNLLALRAILNARADPSAMSRMRRGDREPEPHYTPLHEAAFFKEAETTRELLLHGARVLDRNVWGQAPLHIAAKQGDVQVAKALTQPAPNSLRPGLCAEARQSLYLHDVRGTCPLAEAVDHSRFPYEKLHLLADTSMTDVLFVARRNPMAAREMIKDQKVSFEKGRPVVHPAWSRMSQGAISSQLVPRKLPTLVPRLATQQLMTRSETYSPQRGQAYSDTDCWVELMKVAPCAASDLLEAMAVEPKVTNEHHHPLPPRATMRARRWMNTHYCEDACWAWDSSKTCEPWWHSKLAPTSSKKDRKTLSGLCKRLKKGVCAEPHCNNQLVPVKVRVLQLPNVVSRKAFHAIANTCYTRLFATLSTQAVIELVWQSIAFRFILFHVAYRIIELAALASLVWLPRETAGEVTRMFVWSILCITSSREMFHELSEMVVYTVTMGSPGLYFDNFWNFFDLGSIVTMQCTIWIAMFDDYRIGSMHKFVAALLLLRWMQLVYTLRIMPATGRKLLPIMQSFMPMAGIVTITVFFFAGIFHAFLALRMELVDCEQAPSGGASAAAAGESDGMGRLLGSRATGTGGGSLGGDCDTWPVLTDMFEFLFLGSGTGLSLVQSLAAQDSQVGMMNSAVMPGFLYMVGVVGFNVCILNLFIAVHSEAYDAAQENAEVQFLKERASICLQCLQQPYIPVEWLPLRRPKLVAFGLVVSSIVVWALMIYAAPGSITAPTLLCLSGVLLADTVLLQRPWRDHTDCADTPCELCKAAGRVERSYLWICARADFDEANFLPTEDTNGASNFADFRGRLWSIKADSSKRMTKMAVELHQMKVGLTQSVNMVHYQVSQLAALAAEAASTSQRRGPTRKSRDELEELPPRTEDLPARADSTDADLCMYPGRLAL